MVGGKSVAPTSGRLGCLQAGCGLWTRGGRCFAQPAGRQETVEDVVQQLSQFQSKPQASVNVGRPPPGRAPPPLYSTFFSTKAWSMPSISLRTSDGTDSATGEKNKSMVSLAASTSQSSLVHAGSAAHGEGARDSLSASGSTLLTTPCNVGAGSDAAWSAQRKDYQQAHNKL